MELDELKDAWAQYDEKLSKSLKLNEELLRSINFEKINNALKKPMGLEQLNIIIQLIAIVMVTVITIRLSNEIPYFLMGITSALLCAVSMIFSAVKANRFSKILYYHSSIMNFQKDLTKLRILIFHLRKIEYVLAALIGITLFPLLLKAFGDIDMLRNITLIIPGIIVTIGIGFSVGIWLNLFLYDKGLKDAEKFLGLINKFGQAE